MARLLRANSIVGPSPGWPAGGWGVRAGVAAMPGVRLGAGPNGSVWMREASSPIAARPALISSMKGLGPHRYTSASRGGASSAISDAETAGAVEVAALEVVRSGTAVVHVRACVREGGEEGPRLGGERVVAAAACAVHPPDLAIGTLLRQCLKHGENRGRTDPGADQQQGCLCAVEDEGATRGSDVNLVAVGETGLQT